MSFWKLPRRPEPEAMDEADQVESYSSAAAARHLDAIDNTFVDHLLGMFPAGGWRGPGWGLDIGTGPAAIPVKVLQKIPGLRMVGIDRSRNMLGRARQNALRAGVGDRLALVATDAHALPFRDGVFSLVLANSVLHHARQPVELLREMVRVGGQESALLLRDLRRPSRLALRWHLWRHGRRYRGLMRKLFEDSVRAAYTREELEEFIRQIPRSQNAPPLGARERSAVGGQEKLEGLVTFRYRGAHIGIERRPPG